MCESCQNRAVKLRRLVEEFDELAAQSPDPLYAERLRRTARELSAMAAALCTGRACIDDVVWLEDGSPAEPAELDA